MCPWWHQASSWRSVVLSWVRNRDIQVKALSDDTNRKSNIEDCILKITSREQCVVVWAATNCCRWPVSHSDLHHCYCPGCGVLRSTLIFLVSIRFIHAEDTKGKYLSVVMSIFKKMLMLSATSLRPHEFNEYLYWRGYTLCIASIVLYCINFVNSVSAVPNWSCARRWRLMR